MINFSFIKVSETCLYLKKDKTINIIPNVLNIIPVIIALNFTSAVPTPIIVIPVINQAK